jgi:hypothetical protein
VDTVIVVPKGCPTHLGVVHLGKNFWLAKLRWFPYASRGDSHFGMISCSQKIVCPMPIGVVRLRELVKLHWVTLPYPFRGGSYRC